MRLVAPMLSFTADEVWGYLPKVEGREASVHLAEFWRPAEIAGQDQALLADWKELLEIRDEVLRILEIERKAGRIGKALEAKIVLNGSDGVLALLNKYSQSLKELFNISQFEIPREKKSPSDLSNFGFAFHPADGIKCERCWNYRTDTGDYHYRTAGESGTWHDVCGRCATALKQMGYDERGAA